MFINYEMATIEITKAEAKEAGKFDSDAYNDLLEMRTATGFKVVVKETKRRKADTMKGLTYAYMSVYIEKKAGERKDELMAEFNELRGYTDGKRDVMKKNASYGEVKAWFLEQFEDITKFNEGLRSKREKLRENREIRRIESLIA